jgi:endo-1,4-beta-xylanase
MAFADLKYVVVNGTWGKENLTAVMIDHVVREVTHYKGKCYAWDVINEVLNENGTLRSDLWLDIIGPEYITIAFEYATRADPHAKLYYNEYDIEFKGPKHDGALQVVKMIQDAGLRIDGIGFQSHFTPSTAPGVHEQMECMKDFTDRGLELAITELDVRILLPDSPEELEQQKIVYVNTEKCVGLTVWDFWDQVCLTKFVLAQFKPTILVHREIHKHLANTVLDDRTRGLAQRLGTSTIAGMAKLICISPTGHKSPHMQE